MCRTHVGHSLTSSDAGRTNFKFGSTGGGSVHFGIVTAAGAGGGPPDPDPDEPPTCASGKAVSASGSGSQHENEINPEGGPVKGVGLFAGNE